MICLTDRNELRWYHLCVIHHPSRRELVTVLDGRSENTAAIAPLKEPLRADTLYVASGPCLSNKNYVGYISQVNIWTRALTNKEVSELAECHKDLAGDYVSWKDMELPDLTPRTVPLTHLCPRHNNTMHFFFPNVLYTTAQYLCTALGSTLIQPYTWKDVSALASLTQDAGLKPVTRHALWTHFSDKENEDFWQSAFDEDPVPALPWADGEPNGITYENCAYVSMYGMHDASCEEATATAACRLEDLPVFTLHYTNKTVMSTSFLVEQNEPGELVFRGFDGSAIVNVNGFWNWKGRDNNTLAKLSDEFQFPMGRRKWDMEGRPSLLFTTCPDGHFTCDDASCVPIEHRCDYKFDCRDMSDEDSCSNVFIRSSYKNELPPDHDGSHLLIAITFHVMTVSVSTENMHLELTFNLSLSWTDKRLQFYNLKKSRHNWLTNDNLQEMWTPRVLFPNAEGSEYTIVDQNTVGHVDRNCKPEISRIMAASEGHFLPLLPQSSSSLPITSYIKMLDLWLLTCVLLVFLIVIFHTLIEHYLHPEKRESEARTWAARVDVGRFNHPQNCSQDPLQKALSAHSTITTTTSTTMDSLGWAAKVTLPIVFLIFLIAYITFIITFNNW
ncbi:hypothetical protein E2C01_009575 [Portunus trituberculatus]|uniref:C-type lectin domain-containing protein n=1 Tax=Portunus trituberculatus TaxID=210409 RepID=A0A5B7D652_PORTR|nr:hypothetical protein [Portunus trituberculatus]